MEIKNNKWNIYIVDFIPLLSRNECGTLIEIAKEYYLKNDNVCIQNFTNTGIKEFREDWDHKCSSGIRNSSGFLFVQGIYSLCLYVNVGRIFIVYF